MPVLSGDASDFRSVNEFARDTPWLHGTAVAFANYGVLLFALLLVAGWWVARTNGSPRSMARALLAPIGMLIALAANQPIVHTVNEARPYNALRNTLLLVHRSPDGSFPSDHATMAGAVAGGLLLVSWRLGAVAAAAALLMSFTRVYVGAHYPVDVVAGLAFGAAVTALVTLAATPLIEKLVLRLRTTFLRPLLTPATEQSLTHSAG